MLTHEQLVCLKNYVETQTLHYIQRLFADIEYYLNTQQMQTNSKERSLNLGGHDAQMQFLRTVFSQSSVNGQLYNRDFSIQNGCEQLCNKDFSVTGNVEQFCDRNFSAVENNEQFLGRNYAASENNEQSLGRNYTASENNEQSPDRNYSILRGNEKSLLLDIPQGDENVRPNNINSVQKNNMLNAAIASLPSQYSNGHRIPRYYLERLKLTLQVIYSRPGIVRKELAVVLQVSERTVSNLCSFLLKHHHIVIRDHRDGRWYPPLP